MTPAQALADVFPLLSVHDETDRARVVTVDGMVAVLEEPGRFVAVNYRLVFDGLAEEALAGLLSPTGARLGGAA